jgi:hypothetical protein
MSTAVRSDLDAFINELRVRANAQFTTRQHERLFSVPLTMDRARVWTLQTALWGYNRRDCWGFAQGLAPMDVKLLIWEHEEDELAGNKARGIEDHGALKVREGAAFGLTPKDFANVQMHEGVKACAYAWIHLVKDSHWLTAVAACACLEVSNSVAWVDGGGISYRRGQHFAEQLGIPFEKQVSSKEHAEVDVEHAHMLVEVAKRHAHTKHERDLMMHGAIESWALESVFKGQLAEAMEELPGP